MEAAGIIAFQAAVMFILLAAGYFLYKGRLLGSEATQQLSNITISVINPIVIFNAYQREFDNKMLMGLIWALILGFIAQGILVLSGIIAVRKEHKNSEIERFALGYSNCAFMGIPLVEATFGTEGVFYLTAFITAFNVFMWTHGVILMSGKKLNARSLFKIAVSPAILSIVLGLVFFFTGWRLPRIIQLPLDYLGSMNTPLAMLVSGATIAKAGLKSAFNKPRIYLLQSVKLLVVPALLAVLFPLTMLFGADAVTINTVVIAAAAPTASATIMFSYKYNNDPDCASNHFTLSTIAGIITMPLILALSEFMTKLICTT